MISNAGVIGRRSLLQRLMLFVANVSTFPDLSLKSLSGYVPPKFSVGDRVRYYDTVNDTLYQIRGSQAGYTQVELSQ